MIAKISPPGKTSSKPTTPAHNGEVCGIERETSCDACLAYRLECAERAGNRWEAADVRWEQILRAHPLLREATPDPWQQPEPLNLEQMARFMRSLLVPEYREFARDVLMDLLAEPVAELIADTAGGRQ